jgi:hypothetical protein
LSLAKLNILFPLQILAEILPCGLTKNKVQAGNEKDKVKYQAPGSDLEGGHNGGRASQDNGPDKITSSVQQNNEQPVDRKLHAALLYVCASTFDKLVNAEGHDLAPLVDEIALVLRDDAFRFVAKLKEMVQMNSNPSANCLMILKVISKIIIAMMKQGSWHFKEDLESLDSLMLSLSSASKSMLAIEGFMIFASTDRGAMKHFGTLASLVKQAQDLLNKNKMEHRPEIIPACRVNRNQLIE